MLLVLLKMLHPALFDQFDDPPRIQVNAKTDAASKLAQVFDRQSQSARARRAKHQPVGTLREIMIGQRFAKIFIVDAKIVDYHPALGDACRSTRFKHVRRFPQKPLRNPTLDGTPSQALVLELRELLQVIETFDILEWVEFETRFLFQPKRATSRIVEMPLNRLIRMLIQSLFGVCDLVVRG